jgi:hypothetical protein
MFPHNTIIGSPKRSRRQDIFLVFIPVKLTGFGTFQTRERKERRGVSPQTGTEIVIPSGRTIVFKPSKLLKEKVQ